MQVIGFNFTKISAERTPEFKPSSMSTNIEFTNIEKEKMDILKEAEALKVSFKYVLLYGEEKKAKSPAEVIFEGFIILSLDKDKSKELQKAWKKKTLPTGTKIPLFNLILKKCAAKSLQLQEDLNLPSHIPIPKIKAKKE